MVDPGIILALTRSIEEADQTSLSVERWLDRAKELQRELTKRVVGLCAYANELPRDAYEIYADALASALEQAHAIGVEGLGELTENIEAFVSRLENDGLRQKAEQIRRAMAVTRKNPIKRMRPPRSIRDAARAYTDLARIASSASRRCQDFLWLAGNAARAGRSGTPGPKAVCGRAPL